MTEPRSPLCVAALYAFHPFDDCASLRAPLARLCCSLEVRGTLLLAPEGINGTIAGSRDAIDTVLDRIQGLLGNRRPEVKFAPAEVQPFHRMKVRLKREIVTMGEPDIDPLGGAGRYVSAHDWNALIREPGTVVIDTRNDYEVAIGTFPGAINPGTKSFREFPEWFRAERDRLQQAPRIAMFCTGGIRCEKSTAFLKSQGLQEVYHLQGGILQYLESVPAQDSLWQGECFVFDERVAVGHGLTPGTHALCRACRRPITEADQHSPLYEAGVSCAACHGERSESQRVRYRERERQERLASARGESHIGAAAASRSRERR